MIVSLLLGANFSIRLDMIGSSVLPIITISFFLISILYLTKCAKRIQVEMSLFLKSKSLRVCFDAILTQLQNKFIRITATAMILLTKNIKIMMSVSKFNPKVDYYQILNLSSQATPDQIKKSFRQLAKKYHPDVSKGNQQAFKQVNEAYQILSSPQTKKQYDQSRDAPQPKQTYSSQHQNPYRKHSYQQYEDYYQPQQRERRTEFTQQELRQHVRRQHEEMMKRYTQQRKQYRDLGDTYSNYDKFAQEMLRKKAQPQTDKVTLDSVKRQEELKKRDTLAREQQEILRKQQQLKQKVQEKYNRAFENGQNLVGGFKRMGQFVKDIFRKK